MKTLFVEARKNVELNKKKLSELTSLMPNTIYIAYSIQYLDLAKQVKREIENIKHVKILGFSQVLGCSELSTKADAILLIGESRFHALNLALSSKKEIFVFNNLSISRISKQEIESLGNKERGKYLRFLSSSNVGILVSGKSGQENLKLAEKLKNQLKKQGKNSFMFFSDNINIQELENFPDIDIWVNTACPGLSLDSNKIINYKSLKMRNN